MKKLLLFPLLMLFTYAVFAQAPVINWQKSLGGSGDDLAFSIQQTTNGGYIVAGNSNSTDGDVTGNHGDDDYWVVKLDASGNLQWQKSLGGSDFDYAHSIQQTTDGGYIVAGWSSSTNGDVTGNHGGDDYWVVKLDASGNLQWQKSLGGSDYDFANSIRQTTDSGYIVAGDSFSTDGDVTGNHGAGDSWIVKVDATGNLQWQKSLGGSGSDDANSIQQTTDGGYIVAGTSNSTDGDVTGNHGSLDYWIVKLDATGNLQWQKSLGGSDYDEASSIQQTKDGGYIVAGLSASADGDVTGNHGGVDFWVVKLDAIGNLLWQKSLGGSGDDEASSIQQTKDGGYIVAGFSSSTDGDVTGNNGSYDYWMVKLNATGNLQWEKSLGNFSDTLTSCIQQTTDGGYILSGLSLSTNGNVTGNHGSYDYWVVKLAQGVLPVTLYSFTATLQNTTVLLQWTTTQEINAGYYEVERSVDGVQFASLGSVTAAHNNSTIKNYRFTDEQPLPGKNFYRLKQTDEDDNFTYSLIRKINYTNDNANTIIISPNPFSSSTTISFTLSRSQKVCAGIFDVSGRLIKTIASAQMQAGVHQIIWNATNESGSTVANGTYYLKFNAGNYAETKKIVVLK